MDMPKEQFRIEVQRSVKTWLDWFMKENGVSAAILEDALNKYLMGLKDQVLSEFIAAAAQASFESDTEKEEEKVSGK